MARTRKKTETQPESAPDVSFEPSQFDPAMKQQADEIVRSVAEGTIPPEQRHTDQLPERSVVTTGYLANPSSKRRESHAASVKRLPDKLSVSAGDTLVQLIDMGSNSAGVGIKVVFPEGDRPTAEEKAIIRSVMKPEGEQTGFNWNREAQMWHKPIVRQGEHPADVPPSRPVAIRLDAESRVERLADALKHHHQDPVGFADRVREQRENAANAERIPD